MASVEHVNKARKDQGPCYTCHKMVEAGQAYDWFKANRFSPRYAWHTGCPRPRPSVLEANEKRSEAMAAFEDAYDAVDAIRTNLDSFHSPEGPAEGTLTPETAALALLDDLRAISEACAEGVTSAAEMWRESASNIEDGFGQATPQSDEMNERADDWDQIASDIEQCADEVDEFDASQWGAAGHNPWLAWTAWAESALDVFTEALSDQEGGLS